MWSFESDSTQEDRVRLGKLLAIQFGIPSRNFIPGDWSYFLNTDAQTHGKTGYEGSNAVYLGRGRFSDFYNDHHHYYTYKDKVHEVFQWRNRVFNARRDVAKVQPLAAPEDAGVAIHACNARSRGCLLVWWCCIRHRMSFSVYMASPM